MYIAVPRYVWMPIMPHSLCGTACICVYTAVWMPTALCRIMRHSMHTAVCVWTYGAPRAVSTGGKAGAADRRGGENGRDSGGGMVGSPGHLLQVHTQGPLRWCPGAERLLPPTALRCTLVFWQVSSTKHGRAGRVFRPRWRSGQRSPKRSTRVTDLYRTPAASSDLATSTGSISDR